MPDNNISSGSESSFMQLVKSPLQFKLFLLKRLPMAFLAGLRIQHASADNASVSIKLSYLTKNPFRSIYFACLAMAGELSTGILAMNAIEQSDRRFSLLVTGLKAEFTKKATGKITFTCRDGEAFSETVASCLNDGEARTCTARSLGINEDGKQVASFSITWSLKSKE